MYTMWYERVSRWYENGWYEKTLVRKARLPCNQSCKIVVHVASKRPLILITLYNPITELIKNVKVISMCLEWENALMFEC